MKKVLILGGTRFIGRNLVERLQRTGAFDLTLFHRGLTGSELFPEVQRIRGDRNTDEVRRISKENWDFVIDLSCYFPDSLQTTLECLQNAPERYLFVSTCSVYDNAGAPGMMRPETADILSCADDQRNDPGPGSYGRRKAACERILETSGLNYLIFRPALVYGPYDHTDRFYYWLHQVQTQATLLLPDGGFRAFSLTYVMDLVELISQGLRQETAFRTFNVISQPQASIRQIVETAQELLGRENAFRQAAPAFLHERGIRPWLDLPLWLDSDLFTYSNARLRSEFHFRPTPLAEGIRTTLAHYSSLHWPEPKYGIPEKQRQALLLQLTGH